MNGNLHQYHPLISISTLIAVVGAMLMAWGTISQMENRITQNELLLREVRSEVKLLTDVNRRIAAVEAEIISRRELINDYIGTRSVLEFRIETLEDQLKEMEENGSR